MNQLYARLAKANVDKPFLKKTVLPEWWDDEMASSDAGYARGLGIISSHLGIDLHQLWDDSAPVGVPNFGKTNFKLNANLNESDVRWAKCVALSAAKLAVRAAKVEFCALPSAEEIRREILTKHAAVDLPRLLEYLWDHGVVVLHVDAKPKGSKKMAGIAAKIEGRPVIILSKNHPFNSLMLFDLAHEVGHHVCGHVDGDAVLVDSSIDRSNDKDPQEKEATKAGMELLTGQPDVQFTHRRQFVTAESLAKMSRATGAELHIDPGVVAQNFAYGRDFFPLANAACKIIEGDWNPVGLIEQLLLKHVDFSQIAEEHAEFLMNVAVSEEPDAVAP